MLGTSSKVLQACQELSDRTDLVAISGCNAVAEYLSEKTKLGRDINYHWAIRNILDKLADQAKNKRRVYLDGYEANLWQWLCWARDNALGGFNLTKRQWVAIRGRVAQAAGVKMPHNALRHSFCSYHVALHGDAGKTATLLTHRGNVSILYEHYKGNAKKADAVKHFGILPG
jgi:hypothetical protein